MSDKFNCSMCGECCRHIENIPDLSTYNRGDGVCINLESNLCRIYENRPDICNVEKMYDIKYKEYYTREEFYKINENVCKEIKKLINIHG